MDSSPLPSRTRPAGSFSSSSNTNTNTNNRRNPFTIAAAASLSRSNSSFSNKDGPTLSASSSSTSQRGRATRDEDDIEDSEGEDGRGRDDRLDDLAGVGGLINSPYFTQSTQAITQLVTQPTQLLAKPLTTLRRESSNPPPSAISVPSSSPPRSIVEVPASSPFASPRVQTPASAAAGPRGRLANLMAPVGTSYHSPAQAAKPFAAAAVRGRTAIRRTDSDLDDDEDSNALDNIISIDDSSDDGNDSRRARGDIRPSSFRRMASSARLQTESTGPNEPTESSPVPPTRNPSSKATDSKPSSGSKRKPLNDRTVVQLINKTQNLLRSKNYLDVKNEDIRAALKYHKYNVEAVVTSLFDKRLREEDAERRTAAARPPPLAQSKIPGMIRSFSYQANGTRTANTSRSSTPATPSSQQSLKRSALSPSPRPKRRRLVQGRRHREPSSPATPVREESRPAKVAGKKKYTIESEEEEEEEEEQEEEEDNEEEDDDEESPNSPPIVVIDDDEMDDEDVIDVDNEVDDDSSFDVVKRVLEYFNTCTVDDLVAMLGAKARSKAKTILSHRPFHSRGAVTRIRNTTATGRGKTKSANIGEDIFDEVEAYVVALQAIDVVVAQCEQKGLRIRTTLHRWNVDHRGSSKSASSSSAAIEGPPTPASELGAGSSGQAAENNGYVQLPIPQEPALMRGHCTMKGYQLFGMNWLWELYQRNFGCILADDMGLGKTCQVISFLSHLIESYDEKTNDSKRPWPNLIIVPPSTLANWKAEFKKFAPKIRVTTYSGTVTERDRIFERIQATREKCHVVLTSYSQLSGKQDLDAMRKLNPNAAIFDEGHKMKNSGTALYKSLKRINASWRLILTGTPVQNNLMEMINLLNFIQPSLFERHLEKLGALFSQHFTLQDVSNGALLFSDRVRRARKILEPFILQRRKEQVLSSMPSKKMRVVYCELDDTQKPIYEAYERQFREGKLRREGGAAASDLAKKQAASRRAVTGLSNDQNNVWIQLRKSAIHAQLFRRYYDDAKVDKMAKVLMAEVLQSELRQPDIKHLVNELRDCSDFELHTWCRDYRCIASFDIPDGLFLQSGKVRELLSLVRQYQKNGDRALVFTRFARVLNILRECLTYSGIDYVSLEGATRVEERQDIINEFNSNADIPVFLLTTGSGGTGINLTAANKVIIFDQSDNPQDDVQAENRAHRLGQTREVEIVKLVTRGTIEELVYKACQTKLELAERVTAGSASSSEVEEFERMEREQANSSESSVKMMEEEVRKMMMEKGGNGTTVTPPKSDLDEE